ncbi:HAD family hydrolase [Natronobiforma cellulositropha]|uniref:HAD family hydrolase n=1 Tax=Natronobiforma cellulositropha TaxID=1679076 RepID=UPI0021D61298|nr:HAD family hydrolase [Natronobiforma cellulositropha]
MSRYDAICFDLDHTLCESTQDPTAVLETACARVGLERFCSATDLRAAVPAIPTAGTDREFYELLFAEVATRAGLEVGDATVDDLAGAYLAERDPSAVRFCDGAADALDLARSVGPVGLITNGGRPTQTQKLESLDIADAFDAAVYTDLEAGVHPKPHTIPFERALSRLGVAPERTLHIGDSLHADVAGANAMGMDSAWIDVGDERVPDHQPTYELETLTDLESVLS